MKKNSAPTIVIVSQSINRLANSVFPVIAAADSLQEKSAEDLRNAALLIKKAAENWANDLFHAYQDIYLPPGKTKKTKLVQYKDFLRHIDDAIELLSSAPQSAIPKNLITELGESKELYQAYLEAKKLLLNELKSDQNLHKYLYSFADMVEGL